MARGAQSQGLRLNSMTMLTILVIFMSAPGHAFLRHLCFNPLGFARIDPIMAPNKPSQHLHHLHGSSNLGMYSTDADYLLEGNCTSCSITVDRSAYWTPAMFFQHDNGTLELLTTASAITVYYKFEKRVNFEDQNYTVFPKGFRMVAGDSTKRTWDGPFPVPQQSWWGPRDLTQAALAEKSLGFNCLNYKGAAEPSFAYPWLREKAFIDANCLDGIRAEILFPSCWDGVNLDSPDHKSHVAYPTLLQDGSCQESHPVYLPILFYETIWNTQQFAGVPGQFVLANGDPTGYSYHGDFLAAWQDGILQKIFDDPTCTDHVLTDRKTNGIQEECNVVAPFIQSPDVAAQCKLKVPEVLRNEAVFGAVNVLPGKLGITGVRHDPGTLQDVQPPVNDTKVSSVSLVPSDGISTSHPATVPASVVPATSSSPTATSVAASNVSITPVSPAVTSAPSVSSPPAIILTTSTYTSNGTVFEVVIVEKVVTTTIMANKPDDLVARRPHHGHGHGQNL